MNFKFAIVLFVTIVAGLIVCKITRDIRTGSERFLASQTTAAAAFNSQVARDRQAVKDFQASDARRERDYQLRIQLGLK